MRLWIFLCSLLCSPAVAVPAAHATHLSPAQLKGQIAFLRGEDLWVYNPKTKIETLVLSKLMVGDHSLLDISPDLKYVVVNSNASVFIRPLDGSAPREWKIKESRNPYVSPGVVFEPRWSPDGKRIAYTLGTAYVEGGPPKYSEEVRIINVDGTDDHHVAGTTASGGPQASRVLWSRDGKRIAFDFYRGTPDYRDMDPNAKDERLWANTDGSDVRPVNVSFNQFYSPAVSRDGKHWLQADVLEGGILLRLYQTTGGPKPQPYHTDQITYEAGGFVLDPSELSFGPTDDDIVFGGSLRFTFIDANGNLGLPNSDTKPQVEGIFLRTKVFPRLIIRNAHLVKWL